MERDSMAPVDGRWAVRLERRVGHPIERVWRALTEPEQLSQWFPARMAIDLEVGGAVRSSFDPDPQAPLPVDGRVLAVEVPSHLDFTWGGDEIRFELTSDGDATVVTLTHTFTDRAGGASYGTGWHTCLAALVPVLAGRPVPEAGRAVDRHEELVARFGLDRPLLSEADGRWTVRFERQLTCPAEVAWDLFLGRDPETGQQHVAPEVGEPLRPAAAPEVVLGVVTEAEPPRLLAFTTGPGEPGDHVRLELGEGTGHGARLHLTVSGPTDRPDERDAAVDQWGGGAVEAVAAAGADWAREHA